jgi:drug/metabolite transporter (DMT)-like permease
MTATHFCICRAITMFCSIGALMWCQGRWPIASVKDGDGKSSPSRNTLLFWICARSFWALFNTIFLVWSASMVPLTWMTIMFNLTPFWISILGFFINHERVSLLEILAMILCLILIVALTLTQKEDGNDEKNTNVAFGFFLCILCSWVNAAESICTRRLLDVHYSIVMIWNSFFGFIPPATVMSVYCLITHWNFFDVS